MTKKIIAAVAVTGILLTGAAYAENTAIVNNEQAKVTLNFECSGADYALVMIKHRTSGAYIYASQMPVSDGVMSGTVPFDGGSDGGYYDVIVTDNNKKGYDAEFFYMSKDYEQQLLEDIDELRLRTDDNRDDDLLKLMSDNLIIFQYDTKKLEELNDKVALCDIMLSKSYSSVDTFAQDFRDNLDNLLKIQEKNIARDAYNNASVSTMTSVLQTYKEMFGIQLNETYMQYADTVNAILVSKDVTDVSEIAGAFEAAMAIPYINEAKRADLLNTINKYDSHLGIYGMITALDSGTQTVVLKHIEQRFYRNVEEIKNDIETVSREYIASGIVPNIPTQKEDGDTITIPHAWTDPVNRPQIIQDMVTDSDLVFYDLGNVLWAKESILGLYEMGIVNGRGEKEFAPDAEITRAEFAKMLVEAFEKNDNTAEAFADVSAEDWFYDYVMRARSAGIMQGDEYNNCMPYSPVSRQDAAVMIYRCISLNAAEISDTFADDGEIKDYAKEAVYCMRDKGIINGMENNNFNPLGTATRAQCAKMLYSALNLK